MKVLALNASPRKANGVSEVLMNKFLEGASQAGAEVERHYVTDLDIKGCVGCFSCWWVTPGRCSQRDDMDWLLPKIAEADVLYLGTPIYHYNIIHYLQRLRERTLPLAMPEMYVEEGDTHHPARSRNENQVTVLAAVCGFPDLVNFRQAKGLYPNAVHVLLPAAQIISHEEGRKYLEGFMDAVETAGRTLAETSEVTDEVREMLVVDYPEEVKQMLVNQHNEYSASLSTEK